MRLAHLRLPGIVRYSQASILQDRLVAALLAHKANSATLSPPDPTVITAEFFPVYTCGRREINTLSQQQQDYLRANGEAEFYEAMRGGQTTFHGPGQLVAYPVIDLKRHKITPREYVCTLEKAVIDTCAKYGIKGLATENPGVWTSTDHKIAALGVHLRRNVTSHGICLNINTDLKWFDRIVACGLEGKQTTSFEEQGVIDTDVGDVATLFTNALAARLDIQQVYEAPEKEVLHNFKD